ncbi:MAG: ATP-binding protein [Anaerolineales bacterium]|nr:ATP-binding protein [Anaerolineales bacterium]
MKPLGDPNCPHCGGAGYVRYDVPVGHEKFGKLETCVCRARDVAEAARSRLFAMSNLNRLSHLTFENFNSSGNDKAKFMSGQERENLRVAFDASEEFARLPKGWLLLEGGYGCGKTHLAAAIANFAVNVGMPTLFITVPDLLDSLRFAYDDPETTFEQRFEEIRNSGLLILDDFGTQNATPWAQEKLFQIINFRYINKLPTVITTNLMLDEIEARIRSRLQDDGFVKHLKILAPDYRRPEETSNPGISMLALPEMKVMTFKTFQPRHDEVGTEAVMTTTTEKNDRFGNKVKDKEITRIKISKEDVRTLDDAHNKALEFAEKPGGWLVLLGGSFCGKTHLAAAIGNYIIALGGQANMIDAAGLPDYIREPIGGRMDVTFNRRLNEIRNIPMLILDDLKSSGSLTAWAEERMMAILSYRYNAHLPTVITSTLRQDEFALSYPNLWNKLLDPTKCQVLAINMPPYRRVAKGGRSTKKK